TDANGVYAIANVDPGLYDVVLELPPDWEQTAPVDATGSPIVDVAQVQDGIITATRPHGARQIGADLEVVIAGHPDPVTANQVLSYDIEVSNHGLLAASDAILTMALEPNVLFVGSGSGGPSCSETSGVVTCQLGDLAAGDMASLAIDVVPYAAGTATTTAIASSNTVDVNVSNDAATAMTTVVALTPGRVLRIVDEVTETGFYRVGPPALNDHGMVTYVKESPDGVNDTVVIVDQNGSTPVLSKVDAFPPPPEGEWQIALHPKINNAGTVAFNLYELAPGEILRSGILTVDASATLTTVLPLTATINSGLTPGINNNGTVAYLETFGNGATALRTYDEGQVDTIVDSLSGQFREIRNFPSSINDAGFTAFVADADGFSQGVYISNGVVTAPILTTSDPFPAPVLNWSYFRDPSISNATNIAFIGGMGVFGRQDEQAIVVTNNGFPGVVADTLGNYRYFFDPVALDDGTVVFHAHLEGGGSGVYTGPDPATDKIVAPGDSVFGSTVSRATFQQGGANSAGQVAMFVGLTDGRRLVVVTDRDADSDGVSDAVEDAGPNNGDANGDGVLDSLQANVASLPNSTNGDYVSFESPAGTSLVNVTASATTPPGAPPNLHFTEGLFEFEVHGVRPGGAVDVLMHRHSTLTSNLYYKYGPTGGNLTDHWYPFDYSPLTADPDAAGTGAEPDSASGDVLILHFVDGRRGDADRQANGVIVDPGGPALIRGLAADF
ncbi:MAG: choice-of-anchor U domain-containing protein, partial [Planctomycetota bacterium]